MAKAKSELDFVWSPRGQAQQTAKELWKQSRIMFLVGPAGGGKSHCAMGLALNEVFRSSTTKLLLSRPQITVGENAGFLPGPQPLDAKVLTPSGWTTMGELKVGDFVVGRDGKPTKVLGVFPKGKKDVYKVSTTDGSSTECCEDHLWYTETWENFKRKKPGSVKSTREIIDTLVTRKGKLNHYLPRNEAVEFAKQDLPLPPYTLGAMLGDGHIGGLQLTCVDVDIIDRVKLEVRSIGCDLMYNGDIHWHITCKTYSNKPAQKVRVVEECSGKETIYRNLASCAEDLRINKAVVWRRCTGNATVNGQTYSYIPLEERWSNKAKNIFDRLDLLDKNAPDKFIPDIYKYSDVEDRLALLRGLMDTDGCCTATGEATFTTTSRRLALDVIELVQSLGGRAVLRSRDRRGKEGILNGRVVRTKRISYEFNISLPGNLNPFHLKRKAERFRAAYIHAPKISSVVYVGEKEVQCILVENPEHLYITDQYIVTHNTLEEKLSPWLGPLHDVWSSMSGDDDWAKLVKALGKRIETIPVGMLRGRTVRDAVLILDEAQNCSYSQLKCALTRLGEYGRLILTGDADQSDRFRPEESPLMDVARKLADLDTVSVIRFTHADQQRDPLICDILDRI